jgi:hypothetical protein
MSTDIIWLARLVLAHLLTDFLLQPKSWIDSRQQRHFASPHLYLHGLVTAAVAALFIGFDPWWVAPVLLVTHTLIDGVKSYLPNKTVIFLADQAAHLLVLLLCWNAAFPNSGFRTLDLAAFNTARFWILATAFVFVTKPAGIFIGMFTRHWRARLTDAAAQAGTLGAPSTSGRTGDDSLATAGSWIGMLERVIILILVLGGKYEAIGLLIAAKSILRFNESPRTEAKTEYLLIGTLVSMGLAVITGLVTVRLIALFL